MRMVILTITEARCVLEVLEDDTEVYTGARREAIEIIEEALLQPQEYDIDSKDNTVSPEGD